jgi:hypothetical protein
MNRNRFLTLALFVFSITSVQSATVSANMNALWVYSVSSLPNAVADPPTRAALIQNSSASGVNMLYVSVYRSTPNSAGRYMYEDSDIAGLITQAHAQGMLVYAAYGDVDWPSLGCGTSAFPMRRMAEVVAYNAANSSATFDGVILDVEPSGTPDFQELLELYQCFQQQAQSNGMGLAVTISAFWNSVVTFGQTTKPAYEQIVDLNLTNIVVMGYRNYAGTLDCTQGDGVVCLDENIIAYANSVSKAYTVIVGLDTDNPATSGSIPEETFFSLGQAAMNAVAQSVNSQFAAVNQNFGGFSIHNYRDSYLNGQLTGWPATNPAFPKSGGPPFGSFDTPVSSSSDVNGSVGFTGWALSSAGISSVGIWRESPSGLLFIGTASLVAGARPDVQSIYPSYPGSNSAGWGYLLLTNELPSNDGSSGVGNGTYNIHAIAQDFAGNSTDLGVKTIVVDNRDALTPFGAIDTPAQGGTVSGSNYVNFGWALTPPGKMIPLDGSTIWVYIDGKPVGHPVYNNYRVDIATLFPGYANSQGAVGYYYIDTTKLSNGRHSIAWSVTDSAGETGGIGSRFFTVQN